MSKTPEDMAQEYADKYIKLQPEYNRIMYDFVAGYKIGFEAGYKSCFADKISTEEETDKLIDEAAKALRQRIKDE